ncbi:MAG: starvation-inducible DNA-binding protein [Chthoniobacter sp.]|jgi:starvation-inducible DNA-binding protein|nr:starvation-inducible DNA-binding protein [Chthoniobacter sp.]
MKPMHPTQNSLSNKTRTQVAAILNQSLADLMDLYSQTKQAHWNVRGRHFYSLHKLFDDLAAMVEEHLDEIAERVTALGALAQGTVRLAAANSRLTEFPLEETGDSIYLAALSGRFALCANETRKAIDETSQVGDTGTADLLTAVSRDLDKALWMLEAHTQEAPR